MIRNPYNRLAAIEKKMKALGMSGEPLIIHFTDGTELEMTESEYSNLFDDALHGKANERVDFILEKLSKGVEDESGICYLLEAHTVNPKELWGDEE